MALLRSVETPAGVYLKPDSSLAPAAKGDYVIYARSWGEVKRAVRRTKDRRSRLAKMDGHLDKQKMVTGSVHLGAYPYTHMAVMRQIDPTWPKNDKRIAPALKSGHVRVQIIRPGDVILGPKTSAAMDSKGHIVSMEEWIAKQKEELSKT